MRVPFSYRSKRTCGVFALSGLMLLLLSPLTGFAQLQQRDTEEVPAQLGRLLYAIAPGSSKLCPADSKPGSFLKTYGQPISHKVCNGTKGNFHAKPFTLIGDTPDAEGKAVLRLQAPFVVGANLDHRAPGCGEACVSCWRFEQLPHLFGWVDCDGGTNADAALVVDSHTTDPPPPPQSSMLMVASARHDSGPGAAVLQVRVQYVRLNDTSTCPAVDSTRWQQDDITVVDTAMVTGRAVSTIYNPRRCAPLTPFCPRENPYQVTLHGTNLSCSQWDAPHGAQFVIPLHSLDTSILGKIAIGDVAQVLRLTWRQPEPVESGQRTPVGESMYADITSETPHRLGTRVPYHRDVSLLHPDR